MTNFLSYYIRPVSYDTKILFIDTHLRMDLIAASRKSLKHSVYHCRVFRSFPLYKVKVLPTLRPKYIQTELNF